jgi:uncharacterized protein (DUF1697 family)
MKRYIVLLRGINVSGKNKLPMAELRAILSSLGYQNIQTYIQSGNIVLDTKETKSKVCKKIKEAILLKYNYDVPVLARTISDWKRIIENNPYKNREDQKKMYFTFLKGAAKETSIEVNKAPGDEFAIIDDVVYLYCEGGYGNTKLSNNLFENKLKTKATTRNFNTTMKLFELTKK